METLRNLVLVLLAVVLGLGGWWGYRYWQAESLDERAAETLREAAGLLERLPQDELQRLYGRQLRRATDAYAAGRRSFDAGDYGAALDQGRASVDQLEALASSLRNRERAGEAQVVSVQGEVEVRRGAAGPWRGVQKGMMLEAGDTLRTGGGSQVELVFRNQTYYELRSNSQLRIPASDVADEGGQAVGVDYGWVDLTTSGSGSRIETPDAAAQVDEDSAASIAVGEGEGRFMTYRGKMEVSSADGETRTVGELEQVRQGTDGLSQAERLPRPPRLVEPADHHEATWRRGSEDEVLLAWEPVEGAARYHLQVSESYLFVDNLIEDDDRAKTSATLGVRDQGSFLWRVAALTEDGYPGPWSQAQSFRITAVEGRDPAEDRTPPHVEIDEMTRFGNMVMVQGSTEPGARVTVNGESAKVEPDGSFTRTVQLVDSGWSNVEVRVRDAWGNEDVESQPIFVDGP